MKQNRSLFDTHDMKTKAIALGGNTHPVKLLIWALALVTILLLSQFRTTAASVRQSTVPPAPAFLTVLTGPIDSTSDTEWVVAGVTVNIIADETRFNRRVEEASAGDPPSDLWARVEGESDGDGGLNAVRIKLVHQQPFVKLRGKLTALSDTLVEVDGIQLGRTNTTIVVGNPQPNEDRVGIKAVVQTDGTLLATQVRKEGPPIFDDDHEDDDEDLGSQAGEVELLGLVQDGPDGDELVGDWQVSGIPVTIENSTEIDQHVGPLMVGAWVKIHGNNSNGILVALDVKTTGVHSSHKLEGTLDDLTDDTVVVSGFSIARDDDTVLVDNPTVDQPVKVYAKLQDDDTLLAVKIDGEGDGELDHHEDNTVSFVGPVQSLPADGLSGEWRVAGRLLQVTPSTDIDEHKGLISKGTIVKVEAFYDSSNGGVLTALEISVKEHQGNHDDDHEGDHGNNHYIKFKGAIEELPTDWATSGLEGTWTVDGREVDVDERTELDLDEADVDIGVMVEVKGYVMDDGTVQAREIEIEDEHEDDDHGHGHGDDDSAVKFEGGIGKLFSAGLVGTWTVGNSM